MTDDGPGGPPPGQGSGADPLGTVRAAGACVWRPTSTGEVEVLVVHRPKYDDWSLPKGKLDPEEHPLVTAVREVEEETGHRITLGRPLGIQRYMVDGRPKAVTYWAARADDDAPEWPGTEEIDRLRWTATWQVGVVMTHPRDVEVVRALAAGPPATVPLILLRHTEAIPRKSWAGRDDERPLSADGGQAAADLVPLLEAYAPRRLVSSDTERCLATLAPYADKASLAVEQDHRVSQEAFDEDPGASAPALRDLLADGQPTVVCSHRPVFPVLRQAIEGVAVDGLTLPFGTLRTGDFLVAHHARGQVVAVEAQSLTVGA